ncbi:MAG: sensor histidine kinase [Solirubrobacterales bacterium]
MAVTTLARAGLPWAVATAVTALAAMALVHLDSIDRLRRQEELRSSILTQLNTIRARLENSLNGPLLRTRGMVAFIIANGDITERQFATAAEVLLSGHRNVRNMVLSRGLVIAMTYPVAGNEMVVGVDYRTIPEQYAQVRKSIASRSSVLQGPVPLIQGGIGLIARTPVFLRNPDGSEGKFFGMVNVVLDIPAVFADAGLDRDDLPFAVAIRGRDGLGESGAVISGDEAIFDQRPVVTDVQLPYGTWRMGAVPKQGWEVVEEGISRTRLLGALLVLAMAATAFGTARHITRQARVERALRAKSVELERSNADLERFAYVASHDLQTPLRNIVSYAQLLERRYRGRLDADADDFIGFIVEGTSRMSMLIVDLLEYARVSSRGQPLVRVSCRKALDQAAANLAAAIAEADAEIIVGDLPTVRADEFQLVSLFQNLIGNAVKYRAPGRRPRIEVSARSDRDGWWTVAVADNGIGIDPQYFDKIFVIFQRLHPPGDRSGTGVGLAVCQRIIHRFGGEVWVESTPGEGATFLFTIPDGGSA